MLRQIVELVAAGQCVQQVGIGQVAADGRQHHQDGAALRQRQARAAGGNEAGEAFADEDAGKRVGEVVHSKVLQPSVTQ